MNLGQIQAFLVVARTLSFTRAAEELYTSQQSISSQIINLELELGHTLFDRCNRGLSLTREGRYLNDFFSSQLQAGKKVLSDIQQAAKRREKLFRFGYSIWIDPFGEIDRGLTAFRKQNPNIHFVGCQHHNTTLSHMLENDELDVAVIPGGQEFGDQLLEYFAFAQQDICLCVPEDITDDALDRGCWDLPLLYVPSWNWGAFEWMRISDQELSELGIAPRKVRMLPNVQSILAQLETSRCAAVLDSRFGFGSYMPGLRRIPLMGSAPSMCFCVKYRDSENPITERFVRFLTEFYKR